LEFVIKYTGYGSRYFRDGWNRFDFTILVVALISIFL
jgi:Ion transport protein